MPDSRRRRPGVHVRPGAVRQARLEARLSLAQVAAGKLTRNAIHLVESGRSRPSMETLKLIAEQTGRPLDFFLAEAPDVATEDWASSQHQLVDIEAMLARGELDEALAACRASLEAEPAGAFGATIRLRMAEAHCRRHEPEAALELLSAARPTLETAGDDWLVVEALDWEAAALSLQEDPRALTVLEDARARCHTLTPLPGGLLARIETHIAMLHASRHAWKSAVRSFESAIAHSSSVVDLLEVARIHEGLAYSYQQLGQPGKALTHASRALGMYELRSEARLQAVAHHNLGDILLRQGQLDAAEDHIRECLARLDESRIGDRDRGYALWSLAEVQLKQGRLAEAMETGLEAITAGQTQKEQVVVAGAMSVVGAVYERQGRSAEADRHFEQAVAILETLDQPHRLRDAHMAYAEVLEARNDVAAAARHWRVAAELGREVQPVQPAFAEASLRATAG